MALFSQRKGIRLAQKALQHESIDEDLRNRLWSGLKIVVWDRWSPPDLIMGYQSEDGKQVELIIKLIWLHYFKLPVNRKRGLSPYFVRKGGRLCGLQSFGCGSKGDEI